MAGLATTLRVSTANRGVERPLPYETIRLPLNPMECDYSHLCPVVRGLSLELSPGGRTHGRARGVRRPCNHQPLGPEVQRPVGRSWRMDETYIRVKGEWRYLYRAVDTHGQTIDFLLTEHRETEAALRFLTQAIHRHGVPEKITIDGSEANEEAIKRYNEEHGTAIEIRQIKYLNNMVEQDHRGVKRITRPMLGFKSFAAAQAILVGIGLMHMLKKSQMMVEDAVEGLTPAEQFYALAA
jgi:putative transposase